MSKKMQVLWGLVVFFVLIIADQFAKNISDDIFRNNNFAFSLQMPLYIMYGIYFLGIAAIAVYLFKHHQNLSTADFLAWLFILAGAVSNVGERVILGYVRDWIYISNGVFNLADIYILLGIFLLIIPAKVSTKY